MAASLTFSRGDVRRLLGLARIADVARLIDQKTLVVSAYTPEGRPLFGVEAIQHAAAVVLAERAREAVK